MKSKEKIPVAAPLLLGNERSYVLDCLDTRWISSIGKYIGEFESSFARFSNIPYAIATCNGTAALHLALTALGVKRGDEVLVPALTFVATANAVSLCGARPVFIDSDWETWNLNPKEVAASLTDKTTGILPVHLYGYPAQMTPLQEIANREGLVIVEDAAEAFGARYQGEHVGGIGNIGVFSFFGNKIITTGEGGMVVTRDPGLAQKLRLLRGQGQDPNRRYWFPTIGYNYRMTNIAAGIGLAQMERADEHLSLRADILEWYRGNLGNLPGIHMQKPNPWASPVCWLFTVVLGDGFPERDVVMRRMEEQGIETRPVFYPIHTLPPYQSTPTACPVAERIAARGISLPTWGGITKKQVDFICDELLKTRTNRAAA